jgi:phage terminase large subunit-like protein
MPFVPNHKQRLAMDKMGADAAHLLLYGGSRSGKTFIAVRSIIARAMICPGSRHLIARFRLSHVKASIVADTFPKVLRECFPELVDTIDHKKTENHYVLPNGSEIWYAGLDDKDRTEKILGMEFATIMLEECSQIAWHARETLITRLAQKTSRPNPEDMDGKKGLPRLPGLRLKAYYCENPPLKSHWTYKLFIQKVSPDTGRPVPNPDNFDSLQLNPHDNAQNLAPEYLGELDGLSERKKKRFRDGQFGEAGEAALWTYEMLEQCRIPEDDDLDMSDFLRIVVSVDPSGAESIDDAHRDEIGIIVAGLRRSVEKAIVLEDCTMKGSPGEWGEVAVRAAKRWGADRIVGEQNFGGAMVQFTIQAAAAKEGVRVPYRAVTASRGKVVRAEPISAMYEVGMVEHMPGLGALEDELVQMTTFGYTGDRSPNRADAMVWALTDLFPSVIKAVNSNASTLRRAPQVNLGHAQLKRRRG